MRNAFAILLFALLAVFTVDGAFAVQRAIRIGTAATDSVSSAAGWTSSFYQVDCSAPVQCAVVLSDYSAGTITFALKGYVGLSGDTWAGGSTYKTLTSGTGGANGVYMLQLSPGATGTAGLLNRVGVVVTSDNADIVYLDVYLIYQTAEQSD